jgi:hypothetical protein
MKWGIEGQIFHRVGGGVRFCHSLIQRHPAHIKQRRAAVSVLVVPLRFPDTASRVTSALAVVAAKRGLWATWQASSRPRLNPQEPLHGAT